MAEPTALGEPETTLPLPLLDRELAPVRLLPDAAAQLLLLLALGPEDQSAKARREAAAALFVSVKTVEGALSRVYRKLGVRSRTALGRAVADGH